MSDFYTEGGGNLPQNSYNPSWDLWKATLLRRTWLVQRLARSSTTNNDFFALKIVFKIEDKLNFYPFRKAQVEFLKNPFGGQFYNSMFLNRLIL